MIARLVATVSCLAYCVGALTPASAGPGAGTAKGEVVRVEHYDPETVPSKGPANALVTVELFFAPSYNAGSRLQAYAQLEKLQARHPARIRVVYRIVQRNSQPPGPQLPTLALEAYAQGKFFEFVSAIHAERGSMTRDKMLDIGRRLGLDASRMEKAISEDRYRDVIAANERRLERLRGTTAPMVFMNDKPMRTSLNNAPEGEYETAYLDAYDRARDLLDRGVPPRNLMAAFDAEVLRGVQPLVITSGPLDDDDETEGAAHPLADPPLKLTGLPSLGAPQPPAESSAPVPVLIVCRPNAQECKDQLRSIHKAHDTYRGEIKILWAPWFDVTVDDAAELAMLGDAALCAEHVGSSPDDLDTSPGWTWVAETYAQIYKAHGRRIAPEKLIDDVARKLRVDGKALAACRARTAGATLDWITAARQSGVSGAPAIVIGGRIYHGLTDHRIIEQLVEAELAPGVLGRCSTTGC
ncbi:MAG: hypothetical protein JNL83_04245 [Myxococcales bacterium]|nr:hypothetical protein [Myxococcales bacterium]